MVRDVHSSLCEDRPKCGLEPLPSDIGILTVCAFLPLRRHGHAHLWQGTLTQVRSEV